MSDSTENCLETAPEVVETTAVSTEQPDEKQEGSTTEQQEKSTVETEVEVDAASESKTTDPDTANGDSNKNGNTETATNGNVDETPNGVEEVEAATESEPTRKRKASDAGAASEATEEKRPAAEAATADEVETGGVHPDADMPLPAGEGDSAAIKTKTVEEVQASSAATA